MDSLKRILILALILIAGCETPKPFISTEQEAGNSFLEQAKEAGFEPICLEHNYTFTPKTGKYFKSEKWLMIIRVDINESLYDGVRITDFKEVPVDFIAPCAVGREVLAR